LFPLVEGQRAAENCPFGHLKLEAPVLIDPMTVQARLISFRKEGEECIAIPADGIDEGEEDRAEKTIEILGLNRLDRLNKKRGNCWDDCKMQVADYKSAMTTSGAHALGLINREKAISELKKKIAYKAEFSSVAAACIRKIAPEPVVAAVFEDA
jgi:hypothetical protein